MFELDFEETISEDIEIIEEPKKLLNRNYVYLQLLEKRLKKFEYLEKHNINNVKYINSLDNTYLEKQDYSEIEHSNNYEIDVCLSKEDTNILKKLLEENLENDKIFSTYLEKYLFVDQEIYESLEKIKLRYLGFKRYYQIYEHVADYDINKDYYNYIYCSDINIRGTLKLRNTTLYVFEVLENDYDKKYIFFSNFSGKFYKTNEFIKLDYLANDICKLQLQITDKIINRYSVVSYKFIISENNYLETHRHYYYDFLTYKQNFLDLHTKNINVKGINKN